MRFRATTIALLLLGAAGAATDGPAADHPRASADLNEAASLYHQARFAPALARLQTLLSESAWKRRDSLMLYQYLGMASARLGRDSSAADYFTALLALDSLFRFPKNEDASVLAAFKQARFRRSARPTPPETPAQPPVVAAPETPDRADSLPAAPPAAALAATSPAPPPAAASVTPMLPTPPMAASAFGPGTGGGPAPGAVPSGRSPEMNFAYGAIPFGAGWMMRSRVKRGVAMGLLQAAGLLFSGYASEMQSREQNDQYGLKDGRELSSSESWQWAQRVSFSLAAGTYLFSIFASMGE
jgi:hypothetical protein